MNKEYKRVIDKKKKEPYMKITLVVIPTLALYLLYGILYTNIWVFMSLSVGVVIYLIFSYFYLTKKERRETIPFSGK